MRKPLVILFWWIAAALVSCEGDDGHTENNLDTDVNDEDETAGTQKTCGDNTCASDENCSLCPQDCGCAPDQICQNGFCESPQTCGNGTCDNDETCSSCPEDCECDNKCGDDTCDTKENCETCPADCGCNSGFVCSNGVCVEQEPTPECNADEGFLSLENRTDNGRKTNLLFRNSCTQSTMDIQIEGFSSVETDELVDGVTYAFLFLTGNEFKDLVFAHDDWTYTDLDSSEIYGEIIDYLGESNSFPVYAYQTTWPWSSTLGYTSNGQIYLNTRKSWDPSGYGETITHEMMHLIGFGHGGNQITEEKKRSVPYWVGYRVSDHIDSF